MSCLKQKLHPDRFTEMSPFMAANTAYVLRESWTEPQIAEITVSEQEDLVYVARSAVSGSMACIALLTCATTGIACSMQPI